MANSTCLDSFRCRTTLDVNGKTYDMYSLKRAEAAGLKDIHRLPFTLKILLENLLRHEDGNAVVSDDLQAFPAWLSDKRSTREIAYHPARVLMQDFTGVPAVVDLAAMRDAMHRLGGDPKKINPKCPVDLVIDHSVQVDQYGASDAFEANVLKEMERNYERYAFLKWGQGSFGNFRAVPPGTGICHQVNLEYIGRGVWHHGSTSGQAHAVAYPDTLVGTDSHTTMINGLGVLGWGVGGIEAEAAMLGQPISMLIPEVIGFRLEGELKPGVTATDLVLTVTQMLRMKGVVGKFVEFYGPGLETLSLADRATISNMSPEYGATCGFFPIDAETIRYLELTNRPSEVIELVKAYTQAQGLWHDANSHDTPVFTDTLALNLSDVVPSLAGPKRPQDRVPLPKLAEATDDVIDMAKKSNERNQSFACEGVGDLHHGDVVIAAITSCTNTSNPSVMLAAGLLAKNAVEKGLNIKPWVKSSLAPGSKVVTDYLDKTGLTTYLQKLGFYLVGYGCTTCIGNSGPLKDAISKTITDHDLVVSAVLSGNRNFEGRIHPLVKANWLASPPLVVAYALAGTTRIDLDAEPLGQDTKGKPVYLRDIWPTPADLNAAMNQVKESMFKKEYAEVFEGPDAWRSIPVTPGMTYQWAPDSTYVKHPPFFEDMTLEPPTLKDVHGARLLALLGDSVTTDHISPAGAIKADSPAGLYLQKNGVAVKDFNSYGSRRGNHEVMMRGTFANIRIRNEMAPGTEGGVTKYYPGGDVLPIYDAAMKYKVDHIPLVVVAGKEYGTGSSRDWAAKGTLLLGVKAVIAESFERIHRSNLIGMGVLPLEFKTGTNRNTLKLQGDETFDLIGLTKLTPQGDVTVKVRFADNREETITTRCRIDTLNELAYYQHGGILQYVLRNMSQT